MAARKLRGPDSRSPQSISSSMASVWQIYGVGSKLDQAKMSVFPNVAAQACWIAGRPTGNVEGSACIAARHVWTAPQTDASRVSFHTATA
jgi:hypothetical protein